MASQEAYLEQLQGLLPTGSAWAQQPEYNLTDLLDVVAAELALIDERIINLIKEADPRNTIEMLEDWETEYGLPDLCTNAVASLQERRAELISKVIGKGGQSKPYFIKVASILGYPITIEEYKPFICGISECGDDLNGAPSVRFYWRVHVLQPRLTYFRTGLSRIGERLLSIQQASDLECVLNRLKPAHTVLILSYEGV